MLGKWLGSFVPTILQDGEEAKVVAINFREDHVEVQVLDGRGIRRSYYITPPALVVKQVVG